MKKATNILACAAVILACCSAVRAETLAEQHKARSKLLAAAVAGADALQNMAEHVKGLRINAEFAVRDLAAESSQVATALDAFLKRACRLGKPQFGPNGTCQVTIEMPFEAVVSELKTIHKSHYRGDKIVAGDFDDMHKHNKVEALRAKGAGVPPPELIAGPVVVPAAGEDKAGLLDADKATQAFWTKHCTPHGRLMAETAARVHAMRKLTKRLKALPIRRNLHMRDLTAESAEITAELEAFIRRMREAGRRYHRSELVVEVILQIKLRTFYQTLMGWTKAHLAGDRAKVRALEEAILEDQLKVVRATGMGVPPVKYLTKGAGPEVLKTTSFAAKAPPWATDTLRARGAAQAPAGVDDDKARAAAMLAAERKAKAKLAILIDELPITRKTTVGALAAIKDEIAANIDILRRCARLAESTRTWSPDGTAGVNVEIELEPLWRMILHYQRTLSMEID